MTGEDANSAETMTSTDAAAPHAHRRRGLMADGLVMFLLCAASVVFFLPLLDSGLISDDFYGVHRVGQLVDPARGFSPETVGDLAQLYWTTPDDRFEIYRPSLLASYGLILLFEQGTEPRLQQALNILLHLVAAMILYVLARTLVPATPRFITAIATTLFIVSPLQLEVVAWSAGRSEAVILALGLIAILIRVRSPRRYVTSALMILLGLTWKETAVAFFVPLVMLDLFPAHAGERANRPLRRLGRAVFRLWPSLAVIAIYFAARWWIFGGVFGARYGGVSFVDYLEDPAALLERIGTNLQVAAAPINRAIFSEESWCRPVVSVSIAASVTLLVASLLGGGKSRRGEFGVGATVLLVPFLLNAPFIVASENLIHTRGLYALAAGVGLMAVRAAERRLFRFVVAAAMSVLIVIALFVGRPCQRIYVEAHEEIEELLESVREPIRRLDPRERSFRTINILQYRTTYYLGDTFTMDGAIRPALQRPFLPRDYLVKRVWGGRSHPGAGTIGLIDLLEEGFGDGAFFVMRTGDDDVVVCHPISAGAFDAEGEAELRVMGPAVGTTQVIDVTDATTLSIPIRFSTVGFSGAKIVFGLLLPTGDYTTLPLSVDLDGSERREHAVSIPVAPEAAHGVRSRMPIAWHLTAFDASGVAVARTEFYLLYVEPPGP